MESEFDQKSIKSFVQYLESGDGKISMTKRTVFTGEVEESCE